MGEGSTAAAVSPHETCVGVLACALPTNLPSVPTRLTVYVSPVGTVTRTPNEPTTGTGDGAGDPAVVAVADADGREHGHGQDPRAAPHNLSILPTWASDAPHGYSLAIIKANATLRTGLRFRYHPPTEAGTLTLGNLLEGVAGRAQGAYG